MEIHYLKDYPQHIPLLAKWAFTSWGQYNPDASIKKLKPDLPHI